MLPTALTFTPWHACCVLVPAPGKCKVDETPKGWFITLIHKDPEQVG